ncbi:MAG: hypothetical protein U9Q83_04775 [Bacteroidota bacterium]|nr:hypothetical protein [Bacteroidota bacterium]
MCVVIIGKGDSVFGKDLSGIKSEIWGLNEAVNHFRCDRKISWDKHQKKTDIPFDTIEPHGGEWINKGHHLRRKSGYVANFNSSTMFAINLAIQRNFKEIYLLGFDNKINHTKFYDTFNEEVYRNLFNLINVWSKIFENGLIDEKIYVVEGGIEAFNHISYSDFFKMI